MWSQMMNIRATDSPTSFIREVSLNLLVRVAGVEKDLLRRCGCARTLPSVSNLPEAVVASAAIVESAWLIWSCAACVGVVHNRSRGCRERHDDADERAFPMHDEASSQSR